MRRSNTPATPTTSASPMKWSVSHSGQIHGTPPATAHESLVVCNQVEKPSIIRARRLLRATVWKNYDARHGVGCQLEPSRSFLKCELVRNRPVRYCESCTIVVTTSKISPLSSGPSTLRYSVSVAVAE